MPLDPFINYLCLLRSDIFGLLTLNCFLRLSSQERNLEQSRKGFFYKFLLWHIYDLIELIKVSIINGQK